MTAIGTKDGHRHLLRDGHSLVDALVGLASAGLVAALVAGALTQARRDGRLQVCLGNLNQIGQAMQQYFADFDDQFPWFATYEYRHNTRTNQAWFYGGRYPPIQVTPSEVPPELRFLPEERPLNAYLYPGVSGAEADLPIYRCPAEDGVRWVGYAGGEFRYDPHLAYLVTGTSYTGNWWWPVLSGLHPLGRGLGKLPDYGRKLVRYKLNVEGADGFVVLYGDPLDVMITQRIRYPGWHGDPGYSEALFLDGHVGYQLTDTVRTPWYIRAEWTLWFNGIPSAMFMPAQFLPPYPGIEDYEPPT